MRKKSTGKMSIKEFAGQIGLSTTQVSNAISGRGRVSRATRDFVMQKMEELGYVPDLNARRLGTGRSYLTGLVLPAKEAISDPFILHMIRAMLVETTQRDYQLTLSIVDSDAEFRSALGARAVSRATDGTIVIASGHLIKTYAEEIATANHPCVSIDNDGLEGIPHVGSVVVGLQSGVRQSVELFAQMGHRRIGFIDYDPEDLVRSVFVSELKRLGIEMPEDRVVSGGVDADGGAEAMRRLMSLPDPPTAVFCRVDALAVGALLEARQMGLRVPEDVSIIGHDDLPLMMPRQAHLTSVRVDVPAIGKSAVEMLFALLNEPDELVEPVTINSTLIVRETVGPAPGK